MTTKKKPLTSSEAISLAKKMVKAHNRFTAKENARFEALPLWQKRVQIARDVLAQIQIKRITPTNGTYLGSVRGKGQILSEVPLSQAEKEVSEIFAGMDSCTACALGSLFVCAVDRADKLKVKDLVGGDIIANLPTTTVDIARWAGQSKMRSYLEPFFSSKQLQMIENAFEHSGGMPGGKFNIKGFSILESSTSSLERILRNIIRHKGSFKPSDKEDRKALAKLIRKQDEEYSRY